jgi:hypothetical protein
MRTRTFLLLAFAMLGIVAAIFVHGQINNHDTSDDATATQLTRQESPTSIANTSTRRAGKAKYHPSRDTDIIGHTDPTTNGYDPIILNHALNLTPAEIIAKEPRNPIFADSRETALNDRLNKRLRERLTTHAQISTRCQTSSCEIDLERGDSDDDLSKIAQALDLNKLGSGVTQFGPMGEIAPNGGIRVVMLFSPEMRDPAAYERVMQLHEANDAPLTRSP